MNLLIISRIFYVVLFEFGVSPVALLCSCALCFLLSEVLVLAIYLMVLFTDPSRYVNFFSSLVLIELQIAWFQRTCTSFLLLICEILGSFHPKIMWKNYYDDELRMFCFYIEHIQNWCSIQIRFLWNLWKRTRHFEIYEPFI